MNFQAAVGWLREGSSQGSAERVGCSCLLDSVRVGGHRPIRCIALDKGQPVMDLRSQSPSARAQRAEPRRLTRTGLAHEQGMDVGSLGCSWALTANSARRSPDTGVKRGRDAGEHRETKWLWDGEKESLHARVHTVPRNPYCLMHSLARVLISLACCFSRTGGGSHGSPRARARTHRPTPDT